MCAFISLSYACTYIDFTCLAYSAIQHVTSIQAIQLACVQVFPNGAHEGNAYTAIRIFYRFDCSEEMGSFILSLIGSTIYV
jgi:hypothetical protein